MSVHNLRSFSTDFDDKYVLIPGNQMLSLTFEIGFGPNGLHTFVRSLHKLPDIHDGLS